MARRSDHSREELKAMAIAAGGRIIAAEGFDKFSARAVAREIGYSIGTIYNIFESHDDFILHINAATLDDIGAFISKPITKKSGGKVAVKKMAAAYLDYAQQHYNRWSALFEHNLSPDSPLPDWYRNKIGALFIDVEETLLPLAKNKPQAKQAAQTIWASIHGICQLGLTGKLDIVGASSVQKLMNSMIDNYIAGLSA